MCLEQEVHPAHECTILSSLSYVSLISCILSVAGQGLEWSSERFTHFNHLHVLSSYSVRDTVLDALYVTVSPPSNCQQFEGTGPQKSLVTCSVARKWYVERLGRSGPRFL